jgi:pimeloyl-ACP methyl ester carboxylesterase
VAVDLPSEDESAGLWDYADTVLDAVGECHELVVVGHSLGGFTAPLVCTRAPARLLVLVAGMIPAPGERGADWWTNAGYESAAGDDDAHADEDEIAVYYHDVPPELVAEAVTKWRGQAEAPMLEPWPLGAWPDVPTRVLAGRHDRLFPLAFMRTLARDRLGVAADVMDCGHLPALARPREVADWLERYG